MYAINQSTPTKKITPNILPCSIKHNGAVETHARYWSPAGADDGSATAYFRGRKLRGRHVKVSEGYQGVVLERTEKLVPQKRPTEEHLRLEEEVDGDVEMEMEKQVEVKMMERKAGFEEILVWGHEMAPEDDDVYVKGVQEWIAFAEAVRFNTLQNVIVVELTSEADAHI